MPKRSSIKEFTVRKVAHDDGDDFEREEHSKNIHAVALGSLGGKIGGKARAKALSKQERHRIAVMAAKARWHRK